MDRLLLILLVLVGVYVFWSKGIAEKTREKVRELRIIDYKIAKERFIKSKTKEIRKIYPKQLKIIKQNNNLLYSPKNRDSFVMGNLQSLLKKIAKRNHIELISINWGFVENKVNYSILPISFMAKGYPQDIELFIRNIIYNRKKVIRFKILKLTRAKNKLVVNGVIRAYKKLK